MGNSAKNVVPDLRRDERPSGDQLADLVIAVVTLLRRSLPDGSTPPLSKQHARNGTPHVKPGQGRHAVPRLNRNTCVLSLPT